jgi:hypothetical protein
MPKKAKNVYTGNLKGLVKNFLFSLSMNNERATNEKANIKPKLETKPTNSVILVAINRITNKALNNKDTYGVLY